MKSRMSATRWRGVAVVALLVAVLGWSAAPAAALTSEAKCTACQAMVAELRDAVEKELPRMDVDLRHKLNPKGERVGKTVDWHLSEVRAMEVTADVCKNVQKNYGLIEMERDGDRRSYFRRRGKTKEERKKERDGAGPRALTKSESTSLRIYCDSLLEEEEETVHGLLKTVKEGETLAKHVDEMFCVSITDACTSSEFTSYSPAFQDVLGAGGLPKVSGLGGDGKDKKTKTKKEKTKEGKGKRKTAKSGTKKRKRKVKRKAASKEDSEL